MKGPCRFVRCHPRLVPRPPTRPVQLEKTLEHRRAIVAIRPNEDERIHPLGPAAVFPEASELMTGDGHRERLAESWQTQDRRGSAHSLFVLYEASRQVRSKERRFMR